MIVHPETRVLFVVEPHQSTLEPFFAYLDQIPHIIRYVLPKIPKDLDPYDVIVTCNTAAVTDDLDDELDHLNRFVTAGGGWLKLIQRSDAPVPDIFGTRPGPVGPVNELRVLFENPAHPLAVRLPDAIYLQGRFQPLEIDDEKVETLLYADWRYQHRPMLTQRPVGKGQIACTTLQDYDHPIFQQILYRLVRFLGGHFPNECSLGVGLLGYAPSVGQTHGLGAGATSGLNLRAACDLNPQRLKQADIDFPGVKTYASAQLLANDPNIDLVIVATPPDIHAQTSLQMIAAGKHVVCEKPLALNRKETDRLQAAADTHKVHLSCHQNRRWDVDYLTIRQALQEGRIGDLFYLETFVGGYRHPCGYWHSHAAVSGGTAFDWGGHYIDWILSLIPAKVVSVIGTRQNRVWHDVTNADQERVQIRFAEGQEAEFMHSDIAAVRKPKWYLLGTEGAIIGNWRDVTTYEIDPVLYYNRHDIPETEMTPDLVLHRRHSSGRIVPQKPAEPDRGHYLFHRNLADHLLTGEPIAAPLKDSIRVVAILEAAAKSAANNGCVEALDV